MTLLAAGSFSSVHDFFQSTAWHVIRNLGIFLVVVFWLATVYWVYKDATRRIADRLLVWVCALVGLLPFLGPLIYMLFRPPEYLEDVHERELEIRAMEQRLGGGLRCPVCRAATDEDFLVCPVCTTVLRRACGTCSRPLEPAWQVCPYCATRIPADEDTLDVPAAVLHERRPRSAARRRPPSG